MTNGREGNRIDIGAAVTRSLLGWGVVAGAFYLIVGLALAVTREGFDLTRHPLSLLMLGEGGWMQRANLIASGLMVGAAAIGATRAVRAGGPVWAAGGGLLLYGAGLVTSGIFPPDPMAGFPPGAESGNPSVSGLLHLGFGAVGFVSLAVAAVSLGGWQARRGDAALARYSRASGAAIIIGFIGGAALATQTAGAALLWAAVVAGWAWLAVISVNLYRRVPHPDLDRRAVTGA
jgi:hypothetical protein